MADARYQDKWDCGCAWDWMDQIFIMCPMHKSAPDLLEALRNCLSLVELKFGNTDPTGTAAIEQARAALAKAKGETE